MPSSFLRQWTRPPPGTPIHWASPLAYGLSYYARLDTSTDLASVRSVEGLAMPSHGAGVTITSRSNDGMLFDGVDDLGALRKDRGSTDYFGILDAGSAATLSMFVRCVPLGAAPGAVNVYDLPPAIADVGGYVGIHRGRIVGDDFDKWRFYNFDGAVTQVASPVLTVGLEYTLLWVHAGGVLRGYVNGVPIGSVASGDTQVIDARLQLASGFSSAVVLNARIAEVATWRVAKTPNDARDLVKPWALLAPPVPWWRYFVLATPVTGNLFTITKRRVRTWP